MEYKFFRKRKLDPTLSLLEGVVGAEYSLPGGEEERLCGVEYHPAARLDRVLRRPQRRDEGQERHAVVLSEVQDDRPQSPQVCHELLGLPAQLVPHRVELGLQPLLERPPERALHVQLVVGRQRRVQPLQLLQ